MSELSIDGRWAVINSIAGGGTSASIVRVIANGDTLTPGASVPMPDGELPIGIRRDLRELYVLAGVEVKAIALTPTADTLTLGTSTTLFKLALNTDLSANADGTQFVVLETPFAAGQTLRVLTNWESRLKR